MVPYSQIPVKIQQDIVIAYEEGSNRNEVLITGSGIDENNVKSVIRRYVRFWRERLIAAGTGIMSLPDLISSCFSHYSRQFMQIKRTSNKLVSFST